jgi:hypothetical protein
VIDGESVRRFDQCKNGGLDWSGDFCPSRDYLRQFGTSRDWISGVYSGVCMRFPFIYGQNIGVRIPLSPPVSDHIRPRLFAPSHETMAPDFVGRHELPLGGDLLQLQGAVPCPGCGRCRHAPLWAGGRCSIVVLAVAAGRCAPWT